eukprot:7646822-Lingulodinium_polyedra.AAC.1
MAPTCRPEQRSNPGHPWARTPRGPRGKRTHPWRERLDRPAWNRAGPRLPPTALQGHGCGNSWPNPP